MAPSEANEAALAPEEIGQACDLVTEAGWNQVAADWELFLAIGRVHAVREGGRVIATAATLPYQDFGWISMVLVAAAWRRRGIARRLLRRCVDDLTQAGLVPVLDATPAGQPLYRLLGFHDGWAIRRFVRREPRAAAPARLPDDVEVRPLRDADWPALLARDKDVFGADRSRVLAQLRRRLPGTAWGGFAGGRLAGYLLGRDGRTAAHVGPLVADDDGVALALLSRGLAALEGSVYVDVRADRGAVAAWLEDSGFREERRLTRMLRGRSTLFGDARHLVAIAGPELG